MQREFDIVIVGGGIVGLVAAVALCDEFRQRSLRLPSIALIDAAEPPTSVENSRAGARIGKDAPAASLSVADYDPRVYAITQQNCQRFEAWSFWADIAKHGTGDFTAMSVWDGEGTASIDFGSPGQASDKLGAVLERRVLLSALYKQLNSLAAVDLHYGVKLQNLSLRPVDDVTGRRLLPKAQLELDNGSSISTDLIIGADGANSRVRDAASFKLRQWDYQQDAIVCTVQTERHHKHTAWQCFTRFGPLALLPLGEPSESASGRFCSVVWSQQRDVSEAMMQLSDNEFIRGMEQAFEFKLGTIESVSQRYSFALRQQHATRYIDRNAILIGDAAHSLHPLAGQGINLGINDAVRLAAAIADSFANRQSVYHAASLRRFERERMTENLAMMSAVEGFKRMFLPGPSTIQLLRNKGMAAVDKQRWLKQWIARYAMGV